MSLNDPISNFLTIIRNGSMVQKESVDVPASKMILRLLEILKEDGFIEDFQHMKTNVQGSYKVYLKYQGKQPSIIGLKRISKPGLRVYKMATEIPRVLNGLGIAILSTSKGVISGKEARKMNVGGEILCHIW